MHVPELLNRKKSYILLFAKILLSSIFIFEPVFVTDKDLFVNPYTLYLIKIFFLRNYDYFFNF